MKLKQLLILGIYFILLMFVPLICRAELISERTVINVDDIELTEYELERKMNKALSADSLNIYIDTFIDRAYILAEASKRGYIEDPDIEDTVQKMAEIILMQAQGGLLYEEVVNKNIVITDSDLIDAYKKEKKMIYAECLVFPNYPEMAAVLGRDSLMTSVKTFQKYVSKCENNPKVEFKETRLSWPFMDFILYQDYLYSLKEDEISSPLITPAGVCVLHVTSIEDRDEQPPFEKQKEGLRKNYERAEQQKGMRIYDERLIADAKTEINYDTVEKIYARLNLKEFTGSIEKSPYKDILDETVMSFYVEGVCREITIGDFVDHYNNQIMRSWIDTRSILTSYLKNIVIHECGYREAEKLGITKTKQFVLDRKNYKYNVVHLRFIKNELESRITVNDREIKQAYQDRMDSFGDGTLAKISVFRFDSMANSFSEFIKLRDLSSKGNLSEIDIPDSIKGLIGKEIEINIKYDSEKFSPDIIQSIFKESDNAVIRSNEKNGQSIVIYKHSESGSRIKPLEEVRNEIGQQLFNEKLERAKNELLSELKKKYTIENNIDYDKYLKPAEAAVSASNTAN